jgi:hypothetical protein
MKRRRTAVVLKEENYNKLCVNFMYKNIIFIQYYCFAHITMDSNYDQNR